MNKNIIAIQLTNVTKTYTIHHEKPTLVEKFVKGRDEEFTALRNINLTIYKGERVGIIGPNGSGKTTLLKIIAGIATPTIGTVKTNGKIVSLIDLDAGFHPDLTGYQNIYMNGLFLGMKKNEIDNQLNNIINFAEIRQFIDIPVYSYSTGMLLRLGFSIAVHAQPYILILDEGLAFGDTMFQQKARDKIHSILKKNITLIFVSHVEYYLQQYCKRIILLKKGNIQNYSSTMAIKKYFMK